MSERESLGLGVGAVMFLLAVWALMTLAEYAVSAGMYLFTPGLPLATVSLYIALFTVSDFGLVFLYLYSIYAFIKFKANAVYLAMAALGLTAFKLGASTLFLYLAIQAMTLEMTVGLVISAGLVFLFLLAFFFLAVSKKVSKVFPEKKRRLEKNDKIVVAIVFLALLVFFLWPEDGSVNYPASAVSADLRARGVEGVFAPDWEYCLEEIGDEEECFDVLYYDCVFEMELELEEADEFCLAYMECFAQFEDALYCDSLFFELEQ